MYLCTEFARMGGEPPRRPVLSKSSKGYPETSPPQPRGILNEHLDEASLRRLRQRYSLAPRV